MTEPLDNVTLIARYQLDPDAEIIGAHELTNRAGITYRQLDFWTRCGYLTPLKDRIPRTGYPRVYPLDQVDLARQMRRLVDAGLTTPMSLVHDTAVALLEQGEAQLGDFTITPRQEPA
jgi:hypothetical protein